MNMPSWKAILLLVVTVNTLYLGNCAASPLSLPSRDDITLLDIKFDDNIIVPVTINQQTYAFLVDTGASVTVIDQQIAESITQQIAFTDLAVNYQHELANISTVTGILDNQNVTLLKPVVFSIGKEEIRDNDIWIAHDLTLLSQSLGVNISGILGIDTFRKLNWFVDNENQRLIISKDAISATSFDHCIGYVDSYNRAPQIYFHYDYSDISFYVDTGASNTYVGKEFIDFVEQNSGQLKKLPSHFSGVNASGVTYSNYYILSGLLFNTMPLGEMIIEENQKEMYAVGMDFFSRLSQYAFMPSRMMFCYNAKSLVKSNQLPLRSIAIRFIDQNIELFDNQESELAQFGLQNGDIILQVNGMTYNPAQIDKIRQQLSMTPLGKLNLVIKRDDEIKTVKL